MKMPCPSCGTQLVLTARLLAAPQLPVAQYPWIKRGSTLNEQVVAGVEDYLSMRGPGEYLVGPLYKDYTEWHGEGFVSQRQFTIIAVELGHRRHRTAASRFLTVLPKETT